jgi:hypothetical protein
MICKEKVELENFMKHNLRELSGEVDFYENQVRIREREIQQLGRLLEVVLERKRRNELQVGQRGLQQSFSTRVIRFS